VFRSKSLRPISRVVLITFTALALQPYAAAQFAVASKRAQASTGSGEERFSAAHESRDPERSCRRRDAAAVSVLHTDRGG